MTKKDYTRTATIIREVAEVGGEISTLREIALRLVDSYACDNPRFSRELFLSACDPEGCLLEIEQ